MDQLQAQLALFTGEKNDTRPAVPVSPTDIPTDETHFIPIRVLDLLSHAMRFDGEESGLRGFVSPSILYQHVIEKSDRLPAELAVPTTSRGLNLHYLSSQHYVVSYKDFVDDGGGGGGSDYSRPRITVFDSLPAEGPCRIRRENKLRQQLNLVYGRELTEKIRVRFLCAQHQGTSSDCAVFSVANALLLIDDCDPCDYELSSGMRDQLIDMLNHGKVNLRHFQRTKRQRHLTFAVVNGNVFAKVLEEEDRINFGPEVNNNSRAKEKLRRKLKLMEEEEKKFVGGGFSSPDARDFTIRRGARADAVPGPSRQHVESADRNAKSGQAGSLKTSSPSAMMRLVAFFHPSSLNGLFKK